MNAYSRLAFLLEDRGMTRVELRRRLASENGVVRGRVLARLADPDRPLQRVDLAVLGAVCRILGVGLEDLIVFAEPNAAPPLQALPEEAQQQLDDLMQRHNEGQLDADELDRLGALVARADAIARGNARRLAEHRRWLRAGATARRPAPAR